MRQRLTAHGYRAPLVWSRRHGASVVARLDEVPQWASGSGTTIKRFLSNWTDPPFQTSYGFVRTVSPKHAKAWGWAGCRFTVTQLIGWCEVQVLT